MTEENKQVFIAVFAGSGLAGCVAGGMGASGYSPIVVGLVAGCSGFLAGLIASLLSQHFRSDTKENKK